MVYMNEVSKLLLVRREFHMSLSLSLCPPLTVTVPRARAFQISTNQSRFRRYEENSDAVMDSPDSDRLLYSQHVCVCVCVCVCVRERERAQSQH
jgi:hypothetical protein